MKETDDERWLAGVDHEALPAGVRAARCPAYMNKPAPGRAVSRPRVAGSLNCSALNGIRTRTSQVPRLGLFPVSFFPCLPRAPFRRVPWKGRRPLTRIPPRVSGSQFDQLSYECVGAPSSVAAKS